MQLTLNIWQRCVCRVLERISLSLSLSPRSCWHSQQKMTMPRLCSKAVVGCFHSSFCTMVALSSKVCVHVCVFVRHKCRCGCLRHIFLPGVHSCVVLFLFFACETLCVIVATSIILHIVYVNLVCVSFHLVVLKHYSGK